MYVHELRQNASTGHHVRHPDHSAVSGSKVIGCIIMMICQSYFKQWRLYNADSQALMFNLNARCVSMVTT